MRRTTVATVERHAEQWHRAPDPAKPNMELWVHPSPDGIVIDDQFRDFSYRYKNDEAAHII